MADAEEQREAQPSVSIHLEDGEAGREQPSTEQEEIIYPSLAPVTFGSLHQHSKFRQWCINVIFSSWLNWMSLVVILLSCVIQGSYQPGQEDTPSRHLLEAIGFVYFIWEMLIKMVALGVYGHSASYFAWKWHKLDVTLLIGEVVDLILVPFGFHLKLGHALRPMRLISRMSKMKQLASIILDTLPMLIHILLMLMLVVHIFGVVGVNLWAGQLRNRCFLGEDIVTMYNLSMSPYLVSAPREKTPFICSSDNLSGKRRCSHIPPYQQNGTICTLAAPHQTQPGNWGIPVTAGPGDGNCVDWNQFYNVCRPDGPNPNRGVINFDNIGYAWITVFQVITLEGWTEIMFFVMDAHSVWSFVPFILMTAFGSFILMNTCAVVIAFHFSEAMISGEADFAHDSLFNFKSNCKKFANWLHVFFSRTCCKKPSPENRNSGGMSLVQFWSHVLDSVENFVESKCFQKGIIFTIFLNIVIMAIEHHGQSQAVTTTLKVCNLIFTVVFLMEMILKVLALRTKYFSDQGNLFDFAIVIISLWEVGSQTGSRLSAMRVFRVLRFMKLLQIFPHVRKQLLVLWRTMKEASTLCLFMLFFIFVFSVIGMHLFGCKFTWHSQAGGAFHDRKNFDTLLWSMVTVFQILTQEDWNVVLYNAMDSTSPWSALYFVALIILGKHVLLNVLVGIVVENFQTSHTGGSDTGDFFQTNPSSSSSSPGDQHSANRIDSDNCSHHSLNSYHMEDRISEPDIPQDGASLNMTQSWYRKYEDWLFFIIPPENSVRRFCRRAVASSCFDTLVTVFILLNCIIIAMERPGIDPKSTEQLILDIAFYVLTAVFSVEMLMKVLAWGVIFGKNSYFHETLNIVDGLVVIISLVEISIMALVPQSAHSLKILKAFRLLRLLRPLRLIKQNSKLKLALDALTASVKPVANVALICSVFFFFYSILGVQLFKGKFYHCVGANITNIVNKSDCLAANYRWVQKDYNFDHMVQAMLSLFVMYSGDGWVNLMYSGLDAVGVDQQPIKNFNLWVLPYFLSFVVMSLFLLDMLIGVMVETFHETQQRQTVEENIHFTVQEYLSQSQKTEEGTADNEHPSPSSRVQNFLYKLFTSKAMELFVTAIIILNVLLMAFRHYNQPEYISQFIEYCNYVFTSILIIEVTLKLVAFGVVEFAKDRWNLVDVAIILVSIIDIVLSQLSLQKAIPFDPSILRVCKLLRLTQVLKAKKTRVLLETIIKTLSLVGGICLLFLFFFGIYAALGVELFGKFECSPEYPCLGLHRHSNFKTFPLALLTLYSVCTGDNWNGILKDVKRECRPGDPNCHSFLFWLAPIYFSSFVIVAQFVLVNLVVAVIMQALEDSKKKIDAQHQSRQESPSAEQHNTNVSAEGQTEDETRS